MKNNLIEQLSLFLLKKGFIVKVIKSCFDIIARKNSKILLIKILEDANSINPSIINEIKKLSFYLNASPLIIAKKSGFELQDNIVYSRSGIFTINFTTFKNSINQKLPFVKSNKSGLSIELIGKKLKEKREQQDISISYLSKKLGISPRMIIKYESEDANISFKKALELYDLIGSDVFKPINIFSPVDDLFYESFSELSKKYHLLGFSAIESKKLPFDILAKKENEIIFTKVGDNISKDFDFISKLIEANNLVIFKNKKPKNIPALTKQEFLDFEESDELIKFLKEFE